MIIYRRLISIGFIILMALTVLFTGLAWVETAVATSMTNQTDTSAPVLFTSIEIPLAGNAANQIGVTRHQAVAVNFNALSAEQIQIDLFADRSFTAVREQIINLDDDIFVWQGQLKGMAESNVLLSFNQGILVGKINLDNGEVYQLQYTPNGYLITQVVLPDLGESLLAPLTDGVAADNAAPALPLALGNVNHAPVSPNDDGSEVTIMVLYTPAARDAAGGALPIEAEINMIMAEMNQTAVNSQLNFSYQLAYAGEISASEEITYAGGFINQLWQVNAPFPEAGIWRNQYAADIVSIWGNTQPTNNAGVAFQMTEMDMDNSRFAFNHVRRNYALNSYTMQHEVGHNMAAGHGINPSTVITSRLYLEAFGYGDEAGGFYTIMGADVSPTMTAMINHFSNPAVLYDGAPTGSVYSATLGYGENNAYVMNETAFLVSNYRLSPSADKTLLVDTAVDDWKLTQCQDGVPNDCSLRGAIRLASADATTTPYTITLALDQSYLITETSALYADDDFTAYGDLDVNGHITIEGNGATISGNNTYRIFHILGDNSNVTLKDLTIQDGFNTSNGGGIWVDEGQLTLINCHLLNNTSQAHGGGIHAQAPLTISDSSVVSNTTTNRGGGIYALDPLTITNSSIISNSTNDNGGGIYSQTSLSIFSSTVSYNQSLNSGGGLDLGGSIANIQASTITHNTAATSGGGINSDDTALTIDGSTIANNQGGIGGGLRLSGSMDTIITNSRIEANTSAETGGGIGGSSDSLTLLNSEVVGNHAIKQGAGIFYVGSGLLIDNSLITDNQVDGIGSQTSGGGLYTTADTTISNSSIISNTAGLAGGGIYKSSASPLTISYSQISQNQVNNWGGGVFSASPTKIANTAIAQNHSGNNGGGIVIDNTTLDLENATISQNSVTSNGGGLWLRNTASAAITNSSIVSNTHAGIYNQNAHSGIVSIHGSIVAHHNTADCVGSVVITSSGYNLSSDTSCNLIETSDMPNADPQLTPLAQNGGDTVTHKPLLGSPLVDQIPAGSCQVTTDQRGETRPFNNACDIGAYEVIGSCFVEATGDDVGDFFSTDASALQTAVNAATSGDILKVAGTCAGVQMQAGLTQTVHISQNVTIQGGYNVTDTITNTNWLATPNPALYTTTLDAEGNGRVMVISNTATVSLTNLLITNGKATDGTLSNYGGGIYVNSNSIVELDHSIISNNQASLGAGIFNAGQITLTHNLVTANTGYGGLLNIHGQATVNSSTFSDNSDWGATIIYGGDLIVTNSTFSGNGSGGIAKDSGGTLTLAHSTVVSNTGYGVSRAAIISNTLIAYNSVSDCRGSGTNFGGYNLIEDSGSDACDLTDGVDGNQIGVDPLLFPLSDNGGDTWTHALHTDSSAIDAIPAGINGCGTTYTSDQRGFARPYGANCDIGAYENKNFPP